MVGYSTKAILWYTAVDVGFYLLVKIVRNDLINWFPIESTSVSIGSSLLIRIGAKIVTDYTCILHMRHSFEMGGLHFSLNTFVAGEHAHPTDQVWSATNLPPHAQSRCPSSSSFACTSTPPPSP